MTTAIKTPDKLTQLLAGNRHSLMLSINVNNLSLREMDVENLTSGVYSISKEDLEQVLEPLKEDNIEVVSIMDLDVIHHHEGASQALAKILQRRVPVQYFDEVIG